MSTWAVIATGQSLTQDDVDYVKGKCRAIAVSNAFERAPWAEHLVSHDRAWWQEYPLSMRFAGRKHCRFECPGTEQYIPRAITNGCNSGLMAMFLARDLGATKIILLGFDMHGTHYFGPHPNTLANTEPKRFKTHMVQFTRFAGAEVINCTPGSALECFPKMPLREAL